MIVPRAWLRERFTNYRVEAAVLEWRPVSMPKFKAIPSLALSVRAGKAAGWARRAKRLAASL